MQIQIRINLKLLGVNLRALEDLVLNLNLENS